MEPLELVEPPALDRLAVLFTWGGLISEASLAFILLIPLPVRYQFLRHLLLLGFCILTYAFAPVAGFGWLLLVMGLALCTENQQKWRLAYFATYLLILLYSEIPWTRLIYNLVPNA